MNDGSARFEVGIEVFYVYQRVDAIAKKDHDNLLIKASLHG